MTSKIVIFWFRRDLRLEDNVGLQHALQSGYQVLPLFIFDTNILNRLENKKDRRVDYIHQALVAINKKLKEHDSRLVTFHGEVIDIFLQLDRQYKIQGVFCNRDYEPEAIERDTKVYNFFKAKEIPFRAYKDQVIFDKKDILKSNGTPYTIYTPYAKKWRDTLKPEHYKSVEIDLHNIQKEDFSEILSLEEIGFEKTDMIFKTPLPNSKIISQYQQFRDYPAMQATTQLGTALRFGTISIRKCVTFAVGFSSTWLSELIWREFFMQILDHFPQVVNHSFKQKFDFIKWRNNENEFHLWCEGKTGYPIVDAGMRQLNETGYMHNRVRMIVASFLCKHLLIDWRWGEAYFAEKLNDYDLSSNNGNWQWAAGCGCDAAPYFRVFNPELQTQKFDKNLEYIRRWVPEFDTEEYPEPVVEHSFAKERVLRMYNEAFKNE